MSDPSSRVLGNLGTVALLIACGLSTGSCAAGERTTAAAGLGDQPIVFVSDREGSADLWLMDADGGRQARLTTGGGDESSPSWSPDGARVAFSASEGGGATDIYVIDADGGGLRRVTDTDGCEDDPSWSPDGEQLVVVDVPDCGDGSAAALTVLSSEDGGDRRRIVRPPALWPDWAPGEGRIVYTGPNDAVDDTRIWTSDADGSQARPFDLPRIASPSEPSWSPDGTRIAFISPTGTYAHEDPADWNEDVYVMRADGTGVQRVTTALGNDHWPPAWSPDGTTIVYTSDGPEAEQGDLMAVDLATGEVTRLTDTGADDLLADWRR